MVENCPVCGVIYVKGTKRRVLCEQTLCRKCYQMFIRRTRKTNPTQVIGTDHWSVLWCRFLNVLFLHRTEKKFVFLARNAKLPLRIEVNVPTALWSSVSILVSRTANTQKLKMFVLRNQELRLQVGRSVKFAAFASVN